MSNITVTYRDGRVAQLEQVYIRGSKIRFLILPDMLKNAPMLKSMKNKNQGSGAGRGKAAILKAQGEWFLTNADKWCVHFALFLVHPASWMLFFFFTELFLNLLSPFAVAARGRGRGGMGRGNIFQKRR